MAHITTQRKVRDRQSATALSSAWLRQQKSDRVSRTTRPCETGGSPHCWKSKSKTTTTIHTSTASRRSQSPVSSLTSLKKLRSSAVLVRRTTRLQSISSTCKPLAASSSLSGKTACLVQCSDDFDRQEKAERRGEGRGRAFIHITHIRHGSSYSSFRPPVRHSSSGPAICKQKLSLARHTSQNMQRRHIVFWHLVCRAKRHLSTAAFGRFYHVVSSWCSR